ncbi:MAG TPA: putative Ig domain-containing protein, partial [Bryobacteraceae bacterium]|nr:putative Ig domain-containing protein [Bryobacteraceae bacterium]
MKSLLVVCLLIMAQAAFGQSPTLGVTINAGLGPEISGPVVVDSGTYTSGITATGSGTGTCNLAFTGGGGSGATATVQVNSGVVGTTLTITNEGSGYTSAPTAATVTNGTGYTCTGPAVVSTKIGDPLGLVGVAGVVSTTINPVGVVYNPTTEAYSGLTISVKNTANGITLPCANAEAVVKVHDANFGGNDSLTLGNCTLYLVSPSNHVATLTATIVFPPNSLLPAPLPLAFSVPSLVGSPASQASYTCLDATFCPGQVNSTAKLGITGSMSTTCTNCPSETVNGSATPAALSFTAAPGGALQSQSVTVGDSPTTSLAYAVTESVTSPTGGTWLTVGPAPGSAITGGQTGGTFSVNANPGSLAAGSYSGTVTVYTSASNSPVPLTVNLTIASQPTITTASLAAGDVTVAYGQTLQATGGAGGPYKNWTVSSGSLPAGLTLGASSGTISGTPTATGTSNFSVTVQDNANNTSPPKAFSIIINTAPTITTTSLPADDVGIAYSANLLASGGTSPYAWTVNGSLPAGLTMTANGAISGTPTTPGTSTFTVTVRDTAGGTKTSGNLSITINAVPTVQTASLPNGLAGAAYNQTLTANGGTAPLNWAVSSGSLPAGLTLNTATGAITGTPTTAATSNFNVTVKDFVGVTSTPKSLSITVTSGLTITTSSLLPNGEINVAYTDTLQELGGTAPYTWSITGGSLPTGLTLTASGVNAGLISGTPTVVGNSSFTVKVTDAGSSTATATLDLNVAAGLRFITMAPCRVVDTRDATKPSGFGPPSLSAGTT